MGLVLAFGIINAMWLEADYAFRDRDRDEAQAKERFEQARQGSREGRAGKHDT
ncbi:cytochrome bd-I oxidase subunit CydX [Undibacterium sp. Ji49W]|uniref:cytochrome bd-I oxidase subunit CydX n=1 Tax=Undibacterium sp. Ji49W TaxID=3413040 RepID=UPI003BF1E197